MGDGPRPRIVVATGNAGKIEEFRALLRNSGLDLVVPTELGLRIDVEESGLTYMENARLKARAYAIASGLPALADDSGIEVDALGGAPGVYSARFGGPGLSDAQRTALLLDRLQHVGDQQRTARFRCALVLQAADGRTTEADGVCEGRITRAPRGRNGFGYDPVFLLPDLGRTMAELGDAEKNRLSHRAGATSALLKELNELGHSPFRGNTD